MAGLASTALLSAVMTPATAAQTVAAQQDQTATCGAACYPDSGHAFLFQYPREFGDEVIRFLAVEAQP
jgi:hypothetical protein